MISPIRNQRPPYKLPSNIIYFHDWRYVHHGSHSTGWRNAEGQWLRIWTNDERPPLIHEPNYMPTGIRLRAKPATKSEPFLLPAADEGFIWPGTVIHEEGRYRLWYELFAGEHVGHEKYPIGAADYICYAESDDGENWRFPAQGRIDRKGSKDNNIVYGLPQVEETGLHGATVFKDESASVEERYKMIYVGHLSPAQKERYLQQRPGEVGRSIWRQKSGTACSVPSRPTALAGRPSPIRSSRKSATPSMSASTIQCWDSTWPIAAAISSTAAASVALLLQISAACPCPRKSFGPTPRLNPTICGTPIPKQQCRAPPTTTSCSRCAGA